MKKNKPKNSSAFPNEWSYGMSLRDWYAGMALQGLLAGTDSDAPPNFIAHDAYLYADAMMKERKNDTE